MSKEEQTLLKIIEKRKSWKSKFARELAIWEDIAIEINSTTGKKQDYWCRVMDLYHQKYRND